jgi:hypothetical protein
VLLYLSYRLAEQGCPSSSIRQVLASAGLICASGVLLAGLVFGLKAYLGRPRIMIWSILGMIISGISLLIIVSLYILSVVYEH